MEKVYLTIIVPALNEANRIAATLQSIDKYCQSQTYTYEIIVINDGSTDKTAEVAENLGIKNLRVLSHTPNYGKGYAVKKGVSAANGQYILFMDADNSTEIDNVEKFLKEAKETEVVIASRYIHEADIKIKQPFYRKIVARLSNLLIQLLILPGIKDTQCGFKLFQCEPAKKIFARQTINGWGFDMEVLTIAKTQRYKIKELPVDWYNAGESKVRAIRATFKTLSELFKIKKNQLLGRYSD